MSPGDVVARFRLDPASHLRLVAVADREVLGDGLRDAVAAAIRGGITALQLRDKPARARALLEEAAALIPLCRGAGIPLFVNDRPDVALAAGCAGAHVGPDDLPPGAARRVLGNLLLGVSARDPGRLGEARAARADYVGMGAVRATATKREAVVLGVDAMAALIRLAGIPVVAIGGVRPEDAKALRRAGAAGVAVIGGIFGAADPEAAARAYRSAWDEASAADASY